jgi:hypothetical protein
MVGSVYVCFDCGVDFDREEQAPHIKPDPSMGKSFPGWEICPQCATARGLVLCARCESWIDRTEVIKDATPDGETVCIDCLQIAAERKGAI